MFVIIYYLDGAQGDVVSLDGHNNWDKNISHYGPNPVLWPSHRSYGEPKRSPRGTLCGQNKRVARTSKDI